MLVQSLCVRVRVFYAQNYTSYSFACPSFLSRKFTPTSLSFPSAEAMKRKSTDAKEGQVKRQKEPVPDYCDSETVKDENGAQIWPAPIDAIESARAFLTRCARSQKKALIVPDKDADGLSAGIIIHRTLSFLGLPSSLIQVHLIGKHNSVHDEAERAAMQAKEAAFIIVVDQGSREAAPVVDSPETGVLIIDHHLSNEFPKNAMVVSACHFPPVATSSLLTYEICKTLYPDILRDCGFLCAIGTHGDLGNVLKWKPPFPDMSEVFKRHTKKAVNDAVALINAPRRTAKFDVVAAWDALLKASGPKDILDNPRLLNARAEINEEVEIHTHTPPKFSKDGKIAVLRIRTPSQIHGVIATRWAGYLNSKALEIVMVANSGYRQGFVNFSCRIARAARSKDPPVNIISSLQAAADLDTGDLVERMGESFARGHKEASGGIVPVAEFEELITLMKIGERPDLKREDAVKVRCKDSPQKNNLMNYFVRQ